MRTTLHLFTTLLFLLFAVNSFAQQQVVFAYDAAGNQQERQLICVNCTQANAKVTDVIKLINQDSIDLAKLQALKTQDSIALAGRKITAYPNPLTEVLNVKWYASDNTYVSQINVYSMLGVRVYHQTLRQQQNYVSISFLSLNSGVYEVQAIYNDGRQEIIKVVKK